jgi:hypothetical protein
MSYQIWDTIQAFASSINSALATEAVLKGAGVGDQVTVMLMGVYIIYQSASALAATLTWLMRDGVGMVGRIVFTWSRGSRLDCDCKKWRIMADILNDLAFGVDLLAGHVISELFTPLVCISSLLRAVVGVAGVLTYIIYPLHYPLHILYIPSIILQYILYPLIIPQHILHIPSIIPKHILYTPPLSLTYIIYPSLIPQGPPQQLG